MAKKSRVTAFGQWLTAQGYDASHYDQLGAALGCTGGSIRHYVNGKAIPRPAMLRKLVALTGLPFDAFLFPSQR